MDDMDDLIDLSEQIEGYLLEHLEMQDCIYCGWMIVYNGRWNAQHLPYIEINENEDTIEAGYRCPKHPENPVILLRLKRGQNVTRILP